MDGHATRQHVNRHLFASRAETVNAFGRDTRYRGTQDTAIVGLFGKIGAMTGLLDASDAIGRADAWEVTDDGG